jgi:hypothetical protein
MDFSVIFQLRTKKFWWMDVIFYFVVALLVATIFCYIIFLMKDSFLRADIEEEIKNLQTVGTIQQKEEEAVVINYRNKINDFSGLFKSHEFASNVFAFLQEQTMPNVWFKQFDLDKKNRAVQLSGESDDLDGFSRQVKTYEEEGNKKYIKSIGTLNSTLEGSSRTGFNINLVLNPSIFNYIANLSSISEVVTPTDELLTQEDQTMGNVEGGSLEKLITSFHLRLDSEVIGLVNQTDYTITLNVPYGTDVKNLTPSIVISTGATVLPASGTSQDFTNPVVYIVTAQDGSVRSYMVTVNVLPEVVKEYKSNLIIWIIIAIVFAIVVTLLSLFFWKKRQDQIKKY